MYRALCTEFCVAHSQQQQRSSQDETHSSASLAASWVAGRGTGPIGNKHMGSSTAREQRRVHVGPIIFIFVQYSTLDVPSSSSTSVFPNHPSHPSPHDSISSNKRRKGGWLVASSKTRAHYVNGPKKSMDNLTLLLSWQTQRHKKRGAF